MKDLREQETAEIEGRGYGCKRENQDFKVDPGFYGQPVKQSEFLSVHQRLTIPLWSPGLCIAKVILLPPFRGKRLFPGSPSKQPYLFGIFLIILS